jgi:diguanylate cyclase (GGDEF)-like protein/PAS domain S-box-containing protein
MRLALDTPAPPCTPDLSPDEHPAATAVNSADLLYKLSLNVPGFIFQYRLEADGRASFPYASAGIREIYGVSAADAFESADSVMTVIHPEDRERVTESIHASADALTMWNEEYRVLLPGRGLRWLAGQSRPERQPDGSVLWHGFISDVTERRQMAEALQKSEAFAKATLDAASAEICVLDASGHILAVNEAWRTFYRRNTAREADSDTSIGWNYFDACECAEGTDREDAIAMANGIRQVMRGEIEQFSMEYPCHSPTENRWFIARMTRFQDTSGNVVVSHENITQRRQSEDREVHRNRVLQMLSDKEPLTAVLTAIASDVEASNPACLCSILLLEDSGSRLRVGSAPSLPDFYNEAIDGLAIGPGVGSCGTAAYTGQRIIVEDVAIHPWWQPFRALTQRAGLGACWSQPILSSGGKVLGTFAIYHRHASTPTSADLKAIDFEAQLAALAIEKTASDAKLQLAASVFSHAREGIMITDLEGNIVEVNATFTRITGYGREEVIGHSDSMLKSDHHTQEFYQSITESLADKDHWYGEMWSQRKNGEIYPQMVTISTVRDRESQTINYVSLFTDITLMKEHQHQLERIAHYDLLTGLPNRVLLADRLAQAIQQSRRRQRPIGVVFLDLDGFKAINDTHGHVVGDRLLVTVAQRIKSALRESDTLARIGGDEFVAVLVDLEYPHDLEPLLERMLKAAAAPARIGDAMLQVSASMGLTVYPQDGAEPEGLVRHADQAMYLAKQAGKNRYHLFDVRQDAAVKSQREGLEEIRQALLSNQFVLHYQPKVNMHSGRVIGAEALIRWQHPTRGLLAPSVFLPVIEDHPLSADIGAWVIETALAQMAQWHAQGLDMPVSVNVGARLLQGQGFVTRLSQVLKRYPGVQPSWLEFEVLETSALEDIAEVHRIMHASQELGVHFALDDFGTGYSSLAYLKHLPADTLKIDRSFVQGMLADPSDLAIVQGIIGLAHAFGRNVIAEGVETSAHGERLLALGCEAAQGYGIARPMRAQALPCWVEHWHERARWTQ